MFLIRETKRTTGIIFERLAILGTSKSEVAKLSKGFVSAPGQGRGRRIREQSIAEGGS